MSIVELARPEIRALKPYASARALADSAGILLNANENPWPPADDKGLDLNRYPNPQPAALKARLAELYGIEVEQLLITRGSDEGIDLLTRAFCRADRDQVLICPPCFGMYALSARIQGAGVIECPLLEGDEGWQLDARGLMRAPACRLYYLCSPNNPTGNLIAAEQVFELADRVVDHGLVVVDEAYIELCDQPSLAPAIASRSNLVVLRTLSKAYGLAGCRLGALIAQPDLVDLLRRIIAPYPLPTPSIAAALTALADSDTRKDQLRVLREQKRRLLPVLAHRADIVRVWPGEANFVLVRAHDGKALVDAAAEAGIRLRDQSAQAQLADCVRITIGTPAETDRLIRFLEEAPS
jgi:histidinol-phosphate aminotransferase